MAITDDDEKTIRSVARFCRWKHLGDHRNAPPVDCRPISATTGRATRVQWMEATGIVREEKPDEPTAFCVYTTATDESRHVVYSGAADGQAHAELIASVLDAASGAPSDDAQCTYELPVGDVVLVRKPGKGTAWAHLDVELLRELHQERGFELCAPSTDDGDAVLTLGALIERLECVIAQIPLGARNAAASEEATLKPPHKRVWSVRQTDDAIKYDIVSKVLDIRVFERSGDDFKDKDGTSGIKKGIPYMSNSLKAIRQHCIFYTRLPSGGGSRIIEHNNALADLNAVRMIVVREASGIDFKSRDWSKSAQSTPIVVPVDELPDELEIENLRQQNVAQLVVPEFALPGLALKTVKDRQNIRLRLKQIEMVQPVRDIGGEEMVLLNLTPLATRTRIASPAYFFDGKPVTKLPSSTCAPAVHTSKAIASASRAPMNTTRALTARLRTATDLTSLVSLDSEVAHASLPVRAVRSQETPYNVYRELLYDGSEQGPAHLVPNAKADDEMPCAIFCDQSGRRVVFVPERIYLGVKDELAHYVIVDAYAKGFSVGAELSPDDVSALFSACAAASDNELDALLERDAFRHRLAESVLGHGLGVTKTMPRDQFRERIAASISVTACSDGTFSYMGLYERDRKGSAQYAFAPVHRASNQEGRPVHCDASGIARHYPTLNNDVVTRAYVEYLRREHPALTRDITDDFGWIYKSNMFPFFRCVPTACGEVDTTTGDQPGRLWISDGGVITRNLLNTASLEQKLTESDSSTTGGVENITLVPSVAQPGQNQRVNVNNEYFTCNGSGEIRVVITTIWRSTDADGKDFDAFNFDPNDLRRTYRTEKWKDFVPRKYMRVDLMDALQNSRLMAYLNQPDAIKYESCRPLLKILFDSDFSEKSADDRASAIKDELQAFTALTKTSFANSDDVLSVTLFRGTSQPLAHALLVARSADDAYDLRLASYDPKDVEEPVAVDAALERRGVRVTAVGKPATVLVDLMQQLAAHLGRPIVVSDPSGGDAFEELLTPCESPHGFCIPPRALDEAETPLLPPMLRPFAQGTVYRVVGVKLHDTLCDLALSSGDVVTLPREAALNTTSRHPFSGRLGKAASASARLVDATTGPRVRPALTSASSSHVGTLPVCLVHDARWCGDIRLRDHVPMLRGNDAALLRDAHGAVYAVRIADVFRATTADVRLDGSKRVSVEALRARLAPYVLDDAFRADVPWDRKIYQLDSELHVHPVVLLQAVYDAVERRYAVHIDSKYMADVLLSSSPSPHLVRMLIAETHVYNAIVDPKRTVTAYHPRNTQIVESVRAHAVDDDVSMSADTVVFVDDHVWYNTGVLHGSDSSDIKSVRAIGLDDDDDEADDGADAAAVFACSNYDDGAAQKFLEAVHAWLVERVPLRGRTADERNAAAREEVVQRMRAVGVSITDAQDVNDVVAALRTYCDGHKDAYLHFHEGRVYNSAQRDLPIRDALDRAVTVRLDEPFVLKPQHDVIGVLWHDGGVITLRNVLTPPSDRHKALFDRSDEHAKIEVVDGTLYVGGELRSRHWSGVWASEGTIVQVDPRVHGLVRVRDRKTDAVISFQNGVAASTTSHEASRAFRSSLYRLFASER